MSGSLLLRCYHLLFFLEFRDWRFISTQSRWGVVVYMWFALPIIPRLAQVPRRGGSGISIARRPPGTRGFEIGLGVAKLQIGLGNRKLDREIANWIRGSK